MSDSFEQQVNEATSKMVQSEDGKWSFPEGLELRPEVQYAANLERRRRDTQTAFAKANQRAKALEVENSELAKGWEQDLVSKLSEEQQDELAELKVSDPDAWRQKINEVEEANRNSFKATRETISKKAQQESELERRQRLLDEFSEANPDLALTDDVIQNDIPPRFLKKLENGGAFEDFLEDCKEYLSKGRVVGGGAQAPATPNLATSGGTSTPAPSAIEQSIKSSYKAETY